MFTNVTQTHQNLHPRLQALIIVQLGTEKTQRLKQEQKREHLPAQKGLRYIYLYLVAEISLCV